MRNGARLHLSSSFQAEVDLFLLALFEILQKRLHVRSFLAIDQPLN